MADYNHRRSGMPDLLLWNAETGYLRVCCCNLCVCVESVLFTQAVEVKGPGDSLRPKQRLWLEWMNENGIDAELCVVKTESNRSLKVSKTVENDE